MSDDTIILISDITASAKIKPHHVVLKGTSGKLDESKDGEHVFVNDAGIVISNGGPIEGDVYKLSFNVAGEKETIQHMKFIGHASVFKR
ncbi:MAG: hypothetical protein IPK88_18185 [Saprospiraceae bacterium]|nr:hypothetical protein [Candidatus Defluviibacterium haderslevense]